MKPLFLAAVSSAILLAACGDDKNSKEQTVREETTSKPAPPPDVAGMIKQSEIAEKIVAEDFNKAAGIPTPTEPRQDK